FVVRGTRWPERRPEPGPSHPICLLATRGVDSSAYYSVTPEPAMIRPSRATNPAFHTSESKVPGCQGAKVPGCRACFAKWYFGTLAPWHLGSGGLHVLAPADRDAPGTTGSWGHELPPDSAAGHQQGLQGGRGRRDVGPARCHHRHRTRRVRF